jgi:succinate dehydrogenase/fumarate reductase cytochrome b subunit
MLSRPFTLSLIFASIGVPLLVSAQTNFSSLGTLINNFQTNVVQALGTLAITAAVVAFFFGVVQFIWASREGKGPEMDKGKQFMLWGLIALFVMFSVWGIVKFAQNVLGIQGTDQITVPSFRFNSGSGAGAGAGAGAGNKLPTGAGCTNPNQCQSGDCDTGAGFCR